MSNTLVEIGDIKPEEAPTCFQESNCIETAKYEDTLHAACFANFRLESNNILTFEMGAAFNGIGP